ncbi:MAG: hypothetical protein WD399_12325 [Thermoleophilaceae bacterium]
MADPRKSDPGPAAVSREPHRGDPALAGEDYAGRAVAPPVRRDLTRWGPIFAGLLVTVTTLVVLTVLGVAIGLSAFEPDEQGLADADTAATIWGIASAIAAFFLGGFTAAKTAAVGGFEGGVVNGVMVGVAAIAAIVLLVGLGVGNALGVAATNVEQIAEVIQDVQVDAGEATDAAQTAFENAEGGAWGTFIALLVALAAAAAGGLVGQRPPASATREPDGRPAG